MIICKKKFSGENFPPSSTILLLNIQMNLWLFPTANALINTFLRGCLVLLVAVYGFGTSWYNGYWLAVVHDAISLILIKGLV
jgi:hypothetical protein